MDKKLPEMAFKAGGISATIWENDNGKGPYFTVSLKREYKDKEEWKSTTSMRVNDLPKANIVLQKAYEFILMNSKKTTQTI